MHSNRTTKNDDNEPRFRRPGPWGLGTFTFLLLLAVAAVAGLARGASSVAEVGERPSALPASTSPPVIIGTVKEGSVIAVGAGGWSGSPTAFAYKWRRCRPGCSPIAGALARTYTLGSSDVGATLKVTVTALNGEGSASTDSAATSAVVGSAAGSPLNRQPATISGTARVGQALTVSSGRWHGTGKETFTYQWMRCNAAGGSCANISTATGTKYVVTSGDSGSTLRALVTAHNVVGSNSAVSVQTAVVASGQAPANVSKPRISGTVRDNEQVTADVGKWDGDRPISFTYQWERCDGNGVNCDVLAGRTSHRYTVTSSDVGSTLRVLVTAANNTGIRSALSDPSARAKKAKSVRKKPDNASRPTVSGSPVVGRPLTVNRGSWDGSTPIQFSYSWQRCNAGGDNCSTIGGATGATYRPTAADLGHRLRVKVVARNSAGSDDMTSTSTPVITATAPVSTSRPVVRGVTRDGSALVASTGGWSSAVAPTFSYQWARCDSAGRNCTPIGGATHSTYLLTVGDVGHRLIVQVKAQTSRGVAYSNSDATAVIVMRPASTAMPISSVSLPNRLIIDRVQFTPARIQSRSEPLVARVHVRETTGSRSVSGAYVYAVGVPFNRLSAGREVVTDGDGWATVTFRVLPTFALRRGNLVVVFVRVRKPGGNSLAGVSTRRLISVRVG